MRDAWANRRNSPLIASPDEEQRILRARNCTQEGVRAGVKAASIACVASAVPTVCIWMVAMVEVEWSHKWQPSRSTAGGGVIEAAMMSERHCTKRQWSMAMALVRGGDCVIDGTYFAHPHV
ncbi:hypothetical protein U1Q18_050431 [Sarracenia purpurea var. burkii]